MSEHGDSALCAPASGSKPTVVHAAACGNVDASPQRAAPAADVDGCEAPAVKAGGASQAERASAPSSSAALLHQGGQAKVVIAEVNGQSCARKLIPRRSHEVFMIEYASANRLGNVHAHIVRTLRCMKSDEHCIVDLELGVCDLRDVVNCLRCRLREWPFVREWMLQLAHALWWCHRQGVAHRDVKPENILLFPCDLQGKEDVDGKSCAASMAVQHTADSETPGAPPGGEGSFRSLNDMRREVSRLAGNATSSKDRRQLRNYIVKLCDFGCAAVSLPGATGALHGHSARGSMPFCAPEVGVLFLLQRHPKVSEQLWSPSVQSAIGASTEIGYDACASDIWSFGVTLFSVMIGALPWSSATPASATFRRFVCATQPHVLQDAIMAPESNVWESTPPALCTEHGAAMSLPGGAPSVAPAVSLRTAAAAAAAAGAAPSVDTKPPTVDEDGDTVLEDGEQSPHQARRSLPAERPSAATQRATRPAVIWRWPAHFSSGLIDLLMRCLRVRPEERWTADQLRAHPWFVSPDWQPAGDARDTSATSTASSPVANGLARKSSWPAVPHGLQKACDPEVGSDAPARPVDARVEV